MQTKTTVAVQPSDAKKKYPFSVCLVYPNLREVGASYLGFHKIFSAFREICEVDAAFLPERNEGLTSWFQKMPLADFDLLAFSLTFEMDSLNVLSILEGASIPLESDARSDESPLVCAGGIVPTMNPEPYAGVFDFMVIGEGEHALEHFVEMLSRSKQVQREKRLAEIASVEGVYVPSLYEVKYEEGGRISSRVGAPSAPARVKRLYDPSFSQSGSAQLPEMGGTVFKDSRLIETGKGCGQGCRFCAAGFIYRPVRHVKKERLFAQIDEGLSHGERIGLIGSAICEHPHITEIYEYILKKGGGINVSSLRLGYVNRTMLEQLVRGGLRTLTIAPEAGSERLRRSINKNVTDDEIIATVGDSAAAGMMNVKLYFLIGLPGETEEDIVALAGLVRRIRDEFLEKSRRHGRAGKVTVAVNPFVPKAQTPYQWETMADLAVLKKRLAYLKKKLAGESNMALKLESAKNASVQALLSAGSRRAGALLLQAYREGNWKSAMKSRDAINIISRRREREEILPWDFIDSGYEREYLRKEYEKSVSGRVTPPCPPELSGCKRCGVFEGNCS